MKWLILEFKREIVCSLAVLNFGEKRGILCVGRSEMVSRPVL